MLTLKKQFDTIKTIRGSCFIKKGCIYMKKIGYIVLCTLLLIVFGSIGAIAADVRASGRAVGFYRSDFTDGIADEGPRQLGTHGYAYSIYADSSLSTFISSVTSSTVVFVHTHGSPGCFTLSSSVEVKESDITSRSFSSNAKLVYISACRTGLESSTNGNVCSALVGKGVDTVVAFKEAVSASSDTNGIHRFNSIVVYNLVNGYSIYAALASARTQIFNESNQYWGADSYILYGNYGTMIN